MPESVSRHLTNEDPEFRRREDMLLGIHDTDYEEYGSDPDEPHSNTIVNSYVHQSD